MTAKKRVYKLVQNPVSQRCHWLEISGGTYCGMPIDDDDIYRHNFPTDGIMCGSCLRVRRTRRRRAK